MAAELGDSFEYVDGFAGDFGADAVAGEDGYLQTHYLELRGRTCLRTLMIEIIPVKPNDTAKMAHSPALHLA